MTTGPRLLLRMPRSPKQAAAAPPKPTPAPKAKAKAPQAAPKAAAAADADAQAQERLLRAVFAQLPSAITQSTYVLRWRTLMRDVFPKDATLVDVMARPEQHYPVLLNKVPNQSTRRNLLAAIASTFRHGREVAGSAAVQGQGDRALAAAWDAWRADFMGWVKARARWQRYLTFANATLDAMAKQNLPNPRQAALYTSLDEVGTVYRKLARAPRAHETLNDSQTLVLFSFYAHQVPKRADLGDVRIFSTATEARAARAAHPNHLILPGTSGAASRTEAVLVVGEHKTARRQGALLEPLTPAFVRDLRASLLAHPRDALFVTPAGAPMTPNQFTHFVRAAFLRLVGRATGPTMLRHAYVNERVRWAQTSEEDLEELARRMGHTSKQQRQYKWTAVVSPVAAAEVAGDDVVCMCQKKA